MFEAILIDKKKLPKEVWEIFSIFNKGGKEIVLVGGAVRDLLSGRAIVDWDFATDATPEESQKLIPDSFYNNTFGTVGVNFPDSLAKYEITTYRSEFGYSDNRRPDKVVWGKDLEADLSRRDFTINAMALTYNDGFLIADPFDGRHDLEKGVIRAVGDPDARFTEDGLRMMRAVRFAAQLGFAIDQKTATAIKTNSKLINQIAFERIKDELVKIVGSNFPADGVTALLSTGILEGILPEATRGIGVKQAKHHIHDVWTHSLLALKYCPSTDPITRLATFLHDVGKPVTAKGEGQDRTFHNHELVGAKIASVIANRLHFSNSEKDRFVKLIRWHQFTVDDQQTDSAIRRFIRNVGVDNLEEMLALRIGDRLGGGAKETSWRLEKFKKRLVEVQKQPFSIKDLKVNGLDVMEILGIKPGKKVGEVLEALFAKVDTGELANERETLLEEIVKNG